MAYKKHRYERYGIGIRPPLLGVHAAEPSRYPALLESSAQHPRTGRYDILLAGPGETIIGSPFLLRFEAQWRRERQPMAELGVPFAGGWFLYLGYELADEIETTLMLPQAPTPVAFAQRMHAAAIYDHAQKTTWLMAEAGHEELIDELAKALDAAQDPIESSARALTRLEEESPELFLSRVAAAQAHIGRGRRVSGKPVARLARTAGARHLCGGALRKLAPRESESLRRHCAAALDDRAIDIARTAGRVS